MKYLNLTVRFIIVGLVWSIAFFTMFRSIVYNVWGFDPAYNKHWDFLWQMWKDGWIIDTTSEWLFFFCIFLFVPMWLLGWLLLTRIDWGKEIASLLRFPLSLLARFYKKYLKKKVIVINKRQSYRKVRPPALRYVAVSTAKAKTKKAKHRSDGKDDNKIRDKMEILSGKKSIKKTKGAAFVPDMDFDDEDDGDNETEITKPSKAEEKEDFNREAFLKHLRESAADDDESSPADSKSAEEDGEEAFSPEADFEKRRNASFPTWDYTKDEEVEPYVPTEEEKAEIRENEINNMAEELSLKGFEVFKDAVIDGTKISFVGVSSSQIVLCSVDSEAGDWLADEERFNDEDPLWFSESSHRVSPVRRLVDFGIALKEKMHLDDSYEMNNILAIEGGTVINAMDMTEIWDDMNVSVCRVGMGGPATLPVFGGVLPPSSGKVSSGMRDEFAKVLITSDKE